MDHSSNRLLNGLTGQPRSGLVFLAAVAFPLFIQAASFHVADTYFISGATRNILYGAAGLAVLWVFSFVHGFFYWFIVSRLCGKEWYQTENDDVFTYQFLGYAAFTAFAFLPHFLPTGMGLGLLPIVWAPFGLQDGLFWLAWLAFYAPGMVIALVITGSRGGDDSSAETSSETEEMLIPADVSETSREATAGKEPAVTAGSPQELAVPDTGTQPAPNKLAKSTASGVFPDEVAKFFQQSALDWQPQPDADFSDVAGYGDVKSELATSLAPPFRIDTGVADNDDFEIELARTVLLYGPPGTGKTHLARAIAGETAVGYLELSAGDIISTVVNESVQIAQGVFAEARSIDVPTVVFVDDIEGVLGQRDDEMHHSNNRVVTEFLNQLDNVAESDQLLFIAATSQHQLLDHGILRPGRFDLKVEVGLPDDGSRQQLVTQALEEQPHSLDESDIEWLVDVTQRSSCADIQNFINGAAKHARNRDADTIEPGDFTAALPV